MTAPLSPQEREAACQRLGELRTAALGDASLTATLDACVALEILGFAPAGDGTWPAVEAVVAGVGALDWAECHCPDDAAQQRTQPPCSRCAALAVCDPLLRGVLEVEDAPIS